MRILVLGAAGMVGRKFMDRVAKDGAIGGREVTQATLHDVVPPAAPAGAGFACACLSGISRRRAQWTRWSRSGQS